MSEKAKARVTIGVPPSVEVEVPVEFQKWFRRGKSDIVDRLHWWVRREKKVTLRVCSYTLQTTLGVLLRLFGKLEGSKSFPDVEVLILRPNLTRPLRIWNRNDLNDRRYWKTVREAGTISESVLKFTRDQYSRVRFDVRLFPFDPCVKAIIANDRVAFFGLYVVERHRKTGEPDLVALDYVGTKTVLTEVSGRGVLEELISWFDRTWRTLT